MLHSEFIDNAVAFRRLRGEWDDLWMRSGSPVAADRSEITELTLEHFATVKSFRALIVRRGAELVAGLPFVIERHPLWGNVARTIANPSNPMSQWIVTAESDRTQLFPVIFESLRNQHIRVLNLDWARLDCTNSVALKSWAKNTQLDFFAKQRFEVAMIQVPATHESLLQNISKNHRSKLQRWQKKLGEQGALTFHTYESANGDDVLAAIEEAFAVEASSWKATSGSVMLHSESELSYWRSWARSLQAANFLRVYILRLDNQAIAFDFGYLVGRIYTSVKVSYVETLKNLGVGHLRDWYLLQHFIETKTSDLIDTVGPTNESHAKWPMHTRSVGKITVSTGNWRSNMAVFFASGLNQLKSSIVQRGS